MRIPSLSFPSLSCPARHPIPASCLKGLHARLGQPNPAYQQQAGVTSSVAAARDVQCELAFPLYFPGYV